MNKIKKIICLIMIVSFAGAFVCTFSSCSQEKQESDFMIYYSNSSNDDVVYLDYNLSGKDSMSTEEIVNHLIDKLFYEDPEDGIHYSPLPKDVTFNSYAIDNQTVTLDYDSAYYSMTNVQELILKATVVLTLIQVDNVQNISFSVNGQPAVDRDGNAVGSMNANQYVDILLSNEGLLKQETTLVIYFANEESSALVPSNYRFTIDNKNQSLEEYIINKLIEGPGDGMTATVDPNVELISVMTSEKTCYVNFTSYFLEQNQTVSDELMIYSIVNSLCRLPYVSNVQFLIDGDSNVVLHKVFDLSKPIKKNSEFIADIN